MPESASSGLPAWVYKRDGRLVPFEPDKISQALFLAGEALGQPNAFLARELTDSILYFLAQENGPSHRPTSEIAELIVKVVRELGHPGLAQAFAAEHQQRTISSAARAREVVFHFSPAESPRSVTQKCLREYSLSAVYGRDIVAAHRDGLLTLGGLASPLELAGCVVDTNVGASGDLARSLQEVHRRVAGFVALDGPEFMTPGFLAPADRARLFRAELQNSLSATGLDAIVNLHCAMPPAWAKRTGEGPLFGEPSQGPEGIGEFLDELLEHWLSAREGQWRLNWHLGTSDFEGDADARLARLLRKAMDGGRVTFAFDRPRRPVVLAEGLDRRHSAVLLTVDLNLPRLLEWPGVGNDAEKFLAKLTNLARIAISAAVQKRNFLRRQPERKDLQRGFLLDRARLVIVPVGLESVVNALSGERMSVSRQAQELARRVIQQLTGVLRQHGQTVGLDACLDGPCGPETTLSAGVTTWDATATLEDQLRTAGHLHNAADRGTATLLVAQDRQPSIEELIALLRFAWQRTDVSLVRFLYVHAKQAELNLATNG